MAAAAGAGARTSQRSTPQKASPQKTAPAKAGAQQGGANPPAGRPGGLRMPALPRVELPEVHLPTVSFPGGTAGRVLWWGGLATVAAFGVVDWPVAALVAAGSWVAEQQAKQAAHATETARPSGRAES
jgi:hypothetical protein